MSRAALATSLLFLAACGDLPNKSEALAVVERDVKEEALCTLPIDALAKMKMQHATKGVCVPKEGPGVDGAMACLDALVAAGVTTTMSASYMREWPDEISAAGFDRVSPYERRARELVYKGCVEMRPGLREGQFRCGEARAERIVRIGKAGEGRATVRYARAITIDPKLTAIEAACGTVNRPAPEATVTMDKAEAGWKLGADAAP